MPDTGRLDLRQSSQHDDRDDGYVFEVRCEGCGMTYRNTDAPCDWGSSRESYDSADAARWNDYADRQRY